MSEQFFLQHDNIYILPILHYRMEMAAQACIAFEMLKPTCVAVELAETMQKELLHAASRLPDISVVTTYNKANEPIYYMCEPCDPAFEALRSALEAGVHAFCIDLDVDYYPEIRDPIPDPYAVHRIGLKNYYESFESVSKHAYKPQVDLDREMHMAKRLKELSLSFDRVLFICGMSHAQNILHLLRKQQFKEMQHATRKTVEIATLSEKSCREVMAEPGWFTKHFEITRKAFKDDSERHDQPDPDFFTTDLDRQQLIFSLFKTASGKYTQTTGNSFQGYNLRNLMKFARNYALVSSQLMPDLYQILSTAKGCVDHNYAYEVWNLGTEYPFRRNVDNLPEKSLTIDEVWKYSKILRFHLKHPSKKAFFPQKRKDKSRLHFHPPGIFGICSYPKEDLQVEKFGEFLKKKGKQILLDEAARSLPFSSSIEDGIDIRETIRHWYEKKLYVKVRGKPPGSVGSVVVVFDEDFSEEENHAEKYPWKLTWLGEHQQESDMAFYATHMAGNVIGPGISRCEYGGFMMSYPPRRMMDVWSDPDYFGSRSKAEILLVSAIDYAVQPLVVYVAPKPPRSAIKSYAQRFGKKVVFLPLGQLSPVMINKIRVFHVLDGYDKRNVADEYIF